ncbi:hypothetical protein D3C71_722810 [compost metagenome]
MIVSVALVPVGITALVKIVVSTVALVVVGFPLYKVIAVPTGKSFPPTMEIFSENTPVLLLSNRIVFNCASVAATVPGSRIRLFGLNCALY